MDLKIINYKECKEENKKQILEAWMTEWKDALMDTDEIKLRSTIEPTLNENTVIYALVENNAKQKLIGSICVYFNLGFLGSFYIVKEYRGKGFGTLLLNWVENEDYKQGSKNAKYKCPYTYLQCKKELKQFYLDRNYHVIKVKKTKSLHDKLYPLYMLKELQKQTCNLRKKRKIDEIST